MKSITFLILLAICASCSIGMKEVSGRYCFKGKIEGFGSLNLEKDSSFLYTYQIGLINIRVDGTWKIIKNRIILKSTFQENNLCKLTEIPFPDSLDNKNNHFNIQTKDPENNALPFVKFIAFTNGDSIYSGVTDINGKATIHNSQIDSLELVYLRKYNFGFSQGLNGVQVKLNDFLMSTNYRFFEREKWILKNNKIIDPNWNQHYLVKNCP